MRFVKKIEALPSTIRNSRFYRKLRYVSKQIFIPGFERVPLYDVTKFFVLQANKIGFNQRAAAISYNALLAIPASLILIFSLIPYFPTSIKDDISSQITNLAKSISPTPTTEKWVANFIKDFVRTSRTGLLSTGIIFVLITSSNAVLGIMTSFNSSLIELRKRNFIQLRLTAIKLTLLLFFLTFVTIIILIYEDNLLHDILSKHEYKSAFWRNITMYLRWFQILILMFISIGAIYKYAPQHPIRWRWMSPGTILATVLTVLTYVIFSWYLNHFGRYNEIYGSVGTVIILMLLIYFNALVLLIGFELNVAIYTIKNSRFIQKPDETINIVEQVM